MTKEVYFDNSATTKPRAEVVEAMRVPLTDVYGNPSSLHNKGVDAENLVKKARRDVSGIINCDPDEVIFTSGGTESNNLAVRGAVLANKNKGNHIITTKFEHASVLNTFKALEEDGFKVTYLDITNDGFVNLEELKSALTDDTILISIMYVNSEVGTIQPIEEACRIVKSKSRRALFHVDSVQALCKIPIDVKKLNIDLMSMSSHKIHGPKGVGGLFIKRGVKVHPILTGGGHEFGIRPGTENVVGIVGFGKACEIEQGLFKKDAEHITRIRKRLENGIIDRIPDTIINGSRENRAPHIANISFMGVKAEVLLHSLEGEGIYVSTGAACSSHAHKLSHVLEAMGVSREGMEGAIRFSLSPLNTEDDVDYCIEKIVPIVEELRKFKRR